MDGSRLDILRIMAVDVLREFGSRGACLGGRSAGTAALSSQAVVDPA